MKNDFGEWLQDMIEQRGWSQSELARRAGTTSTTVSRVLSKERLPGVDFCRGVARAFNMTDVDVMKIAGLADSPSPDDQPPSLREMISRFVALSDKDQEAILDHARALDEMRHAQQRRGLKPKTKTG